MLTVKKYEEMGKGSRKLFERLGSFALLALPTPRGILPAVPVRAFRRHGLHRLAFEVFRRVL